MVRTARWGGRSGSGLWTRGPVVRYVLSVDIEFRSTHYSHTYRQHIGRKIASRGLSTRSQLHVLWRCSSHK